ncbi:MAG: Transcriptional regulator, LuxR family [Chloroflexi bacterium]|jgi:DNA-binding NarL/FixJ family response regulator|nr:Transcriptional regulator, LuxR family [Chloroflexota bacterium]
MSSDIVTIPLLIVDDHPVVRHGLQAILQTDATLRVVGEAEDGLDALEKVAELQPRVVLMDVHMPRMDGLAATRKIKERFPRVAVVILTLYNNEQYVVEAVKAGAAGYLLKTSSRDEISNTIHEVNSGGMLIRSSTLHKALAGTLESDTPIPISAGPVWQARADVERLSPRELDVLRLVVEGKTNKDIGSTLYITEDTAKKHVQNIIGKMQVSDRTQAAVKALRIGMLK